MRLISALFILFILSLGSNIYAACPPNAISASASPSSVYGYTIGYTLSYAGCTFRTLEEAEYWARQGNGTSGPALLLSFPLIGELDQPNQGGGTLDYRPNGAYDPSSPILFGAPAIVQTSYSTFVKGWPPAQVASTCQSQACTTGTCSSFTNEVSLVQCEFQATWGQSTAHPEFCWSPTGVQSVNQFTRAPTVSGAGSASGTITFAPSSSTANDSGASVTITATPCGGNTSLVNSVGADQSQQSKTAVGNSKAVTSSASFSWGVSQQNNATCSAGSIINGAASGMSNACTSSPFQKVTISPPSQQNSSGQCGVGDPCFPANGNSEAIEHGFRYGRISFDLYYNSLRQTRPYSYIDENWSDTYAKRVLTEWATDGHIYSPDTAGDESRMTIQDEEGHVETYLEEVATSGIYRSTNTVGRVLRWYPQSGSTPPFWELYYPDGAINVFDRAGRLIEIVHPDDPRSTLTISYLATFNYPVGSTTPYFDDTAHLSEPFWRVGQITDGTGRFVTFHYSQDQYYWLSSIVADDGVTTLMSFGYANSDNVHRLTSTTQFGQTRQYLYNEPANIGVTSSAVGYWLTGIVDELSQRYATYQYDTWGRATGSWHGTDAEKVSISYPSDANGNPIDGQAIATLPLGKTDTYTYPSNEPYRHPGKITDSSNDATQFTYDDANGSASTYRKTKTEDANGNYTQYQYDSSAAHETVMTEGLGTPQQRQIQTDWDVVVQNGAGVPVTNRILAKRIYDASGIETESTWFYNSNGQIGARCDYNPTVMTPASYRCGSSTNAPSGVRQWIYSYCAAVGTGCPSTEFLQKINGPRLTTDPGMSGVDDVTSFSYYTAISTGGCSTGTSPCYHAGDLAQVTDALGHVTSYVIYDKWGHVLRTQDANGVYTDMTYYPRGWLNTRTVRANANGTSNSTLDATTTFNYNAVGNVTSIVQPDGTAMEFGYDDAHRLTDIYDSASITSYTNNSDHIHYTLDQAGNRTNENTYDPANTLKRSLSRQYDQLNHLLRVIHASSAWAQLFENPAEAAPAGTTYTDGYDGNGNAIYSMDANSIGTEQQYDPLNRLVKTLQDHAGTGSTKDTATRYTYDARDNLLSVTDPDNLTTNYTYDGLNNLTQLTSPDTGTTLYPSYDGAGNRLSLQDANQTANGTTINYSYDALNRLIGITYPTTSLNVTYAYDIPPATGCYNIGRLTKITDSSGSTTYCYDPRGNVATKTQVTNSTTFTTGYTYTLTDRISSITYPSGAIVTYGRDSTGRVNLVKYQANSSAATQTMVSNVSYYPYGPANVLTFGNGRTLTKTYDQNYAISHLDSSDINSFAFGFGLDQMGNVKVIRIADNGVQLPNRKINSYDPLYRLTGATNGNGNVLEAYSYDATGDRLSKTYQGNTDTYGYTSPLISHQLQNIDGAPRDYDANGNLLDRGYIGSSWSFEYDDRNRLVGAGYLNECLACSHTSTTYDYNGRGERVTKSTTIGNAQFNKFVTTTTDYVYNESGQLLGEYPGTINVQQAEYIYLDGTPIAYVTGGQLYYIETDQLGTPRTVVQPGATTSNDTIVWSWDYSGSAFGEDAPNVQTITFNLRFPGQYFDQETGLNYNGARDYEPGTGRYVESDPVGLGSGLITYGYTLNNPLRLIDHNGASPEAFGMMPDGGWGTNTIMCDGNGGIVPYIWPHYTPEQLACFGDCLVIHEMSHAEDYHQANPSICKGQPHGLLLHDPSWYTSDQSELKAYGRSIPCLENKLAAIKSGDTCPNCKKELEDELNREEQERAKYEYDLGHHRL